MFYIIVLILCVILFFWVKNKVFAAKEEKRINMHNKLKEANKELYNEYKGNNQNQ